MPKTSKTETTPQKILRAALNAAQDMPWDMLSMQDVAKAAALDLDVLYDHVQDKTDILVLYGRHIDRRVLQEFSKANLNESLKDRLFDVLMTRFDAVQEDREAVLSILQSLKSDPKALLISAPQVKHSMAWMLEATGHSVYGLKGAAQIAGLALVYVNTVRVWMKDDSADMAQTMAALDKNLNRFCRLFQLSE